CSEQQGETARAAFVAWHVLGDHEAALTADELIHVHDGCALGCVVVTGPLYASTELFDLVERYTTEGRGEPGDLVHDLAGMFIVHGITHGVRQGAGHFPVRKAA